MVLADQRDARLAWRVLVVALALLSGAARAQSEAPSGRESTPQSAVREFLEAGRAGDYERAAAQLDLRAAAAGESGAALARRFKAVLDRTLWVDLESLSDAPEGESKDGLPASQDLVGTIRSGDSEVPVLVSRTRAADGSRVWKFSAKTVAAVVGLYDDLSGQWIEDQLPETLTRVRWLELGLWQWLGLLALGALAAAASLAVAAVVIALARRSIERRGGLLDVRFVQIARGPLRALGALAIFSAGQSALALTVPAARLLRIGEQLFALAVATWLLIRVVEFGADRFAARMAAEGRTGAGPIVSIASRFARIVIVMLAAVALLQNLGFDVTALFAGLGLGGLALALAAQKTVENLFGGVTLLIDQPVRVGDFCRFDDRVGTVEEVGLRSTRVRTLDRTVVTVPNGQFASLKLENFTRRDRIWLHATLGLRYETTPDQLRCVLDELEKLLRSDERVDPDPARVRFVGFGAYSLDLEVFAYIRTSDYGRFLEIQQELNLAMMDVISAAGTGFAFPSQTIYGAPDSGLDGDRSREAEARGRERRARDDRASTPGGG